MPETKHVGRMFERKTARKRPKRDQVSATEFNWRKALVELRDLRAIKTGSKLNNFYRD
jgi:hypothetical protein